MNEEWVYVTDELENAIDYLEKAAEFFQEGNDQHRFKWLMITLHGALYGFGICNIQGTNPIETVLKPLKASKRKLKEAKKDNSKSILDKPSDNQVFNFINYYIEGKVLSIREILKRCQSSDYMMQHNEMSKVLCLTSKQETAIDFLIDYRNDFAHFKPAAYCITGNYDEDIILPVVEVIKFLALDSNNINYSEMKLEEKIRKALNKFYNRS